MRTHAFIAHQPRAWLIATAACGLLIFLTGGCRGEKSVACRPVSGKVLLGAKPVAEATVVFHRLDGAHPEGVPLPLAYTSADGSFSLTTLKSGDGAPLGEYAVTIELKQARMVGEELVRDGRQLLPARFATPAQTPLRYSVRPGENPPAAFDLAAPVRPQ